MNPGVGAMASAVLVFVGTGLLAALLVAALYLVSRNTMQRLPPATRAGLLLSLACAPAVTGLTVLIVSLSPSLIHLLGLGVDHCQEHGHHAHFCLVHTPLLTGKDLDRIILLAVGGVILLLAASIAYRLRRVRRVVGALKSLQVQDLLSGPYKAVDSSTAFALTAGLLRPQVYLSSRLLSELSTTELAIVEQHEQTHRRRRDALRLFTADLLSGLYLPPLRERLLADLHLASEQACDEQAALNAGDRLGVAETILKVLRLSGGKDSATELLLPTITGSDVQTRIEALLRPPATESNGLRLLALSVIGLLCGLSYAYADGLHHTVESVLHLLIN